MGKEEEIRISIYNIISSAIIIGFAFGLWRFLINLLDNSYLKYKLYNITLFDLQHLLNKYLLIFIILSVLIYILAIATRWGFYVIDKSDSMRAHSGDRKINSITLMLTLILICSFILYSFYPELIAYLKTTSFSKTLASYSDSKLQTLIIFISVFSLSSIIIAILGTYALSKIRIIDFIQRVTNKILHSTLILPIGITIVSFVLLFNLFMFGYARLNKPDGPNVVLISIDTLRADRLGSYGHYRDTTPNIDRLAEESILFENAYSQAPWTLPAMATIHSSLYPSEHGATRFDLSMNNNLITLSEYMRNSFYKTIGIISHSFVSSMYGFGQGFQVFDEEIIMGAEGTSSEALTKKAKRYIEEYKDDKFFLWIHYFDPHYTYIHHDKYHYGKEYTGDLPHDLSIKFLARNKANLSTEDIEYVKDIYDEEISYTDDYVGMIIDALEDQELKQDTVIIITSDHGEEFMERGTMGHGKEVYEELIRVPLIIYIPNEENRRVKNNVEIRSIYKTILDITGIDYENAGGVNLLTIGKEKKEDYIYSEGSYAWGESNLRLAIIKDEFKLIQNLDNNTFELYNLTSDPGEKSDLINSTDKKVKNNKSRLLSILSQHQKQRLEELQQVDLNEDDIKRLKALGYIQ